MNEQKHVGILSLPVLVGALGYFVDIYDLLLFTLVGEKSLTDLGVTGDVINHYKLSILNYQMLGLMLGGILWGVLGDRIGRMKVLFGSILIYSIGNIANGFVDTVEQYNWLRFFTGIGLAGELGAGITLVSELLSKEKRGIGTSLVAGVGLTGCVVAYFISKELDWRTCYFLGGGLGLLLLMLRVGVLESGMFHTMKELDVQKGNFLMFFNSAYRFKKYLLCILIGLPTWYVIGILVNLSNKFAANMGVLGKVQSDKAIMLAYAAIAIGDISIGLLSQYLKSRKKSLYIFYGFSVLSFIAYFNLDGSSSQSMYLVCAALGFSTGFWAIFVTIAAESFGTNLRATAATTVPNMVRGALPLITILFTYLQGSYSFLHAAMITGVIVFIISITAALNIEETFHKDLNYLEH
ncbi:MAG: MFS transporter [Saprospiraceae bacterium]|nr:MFS transporter [Saprospiraceae bacterium]